MKKKGKIFGIVVLCFAIIVVTEILISKTPARASGQKTQGISFIQAAAYKYNVPAEDLVVVNAKWETLPLTGVEVFRAKVYDNKRERIYGIALDGSDNIVDFASLKAAETRAFNETYGKLTPKLNRMVKSLSAEDMVPVAIWLKVDQSRIPKRNVSKDKAAQDLKALIKDTTADLEAELRAREITIDYVSSNAPLIYAKVKNSDLDSGSWLSQRGDVQRIYEADNVNEDYLRYQTKSSRIPKVWNRGINGTGVTVAIIEDSRVDFNNTCLPNNAGTRVPGDSNVDNHATTTAGMVGSTHGNDRGAAYNASIYSGNGTTYSDPNMAAALDASATNADVLNNSWGPSCADGTVNIHGRHADWIVRNQADTVVAAAGNSGLTPSCAYVGGVGSGYNTLAVGSFNNNRTGLWVDDGMSGFSSYRDPMGPSESYTHSKPEVAAPGEDPSTGWSGWQTFGIRSLNMTPPTDCVRGGVGNGTSYASPIVAGLAALCMDRNSNLKGWPEPVKALIMVNAIHNLEGATRLSEYDGAGGISGKKTDTNLKNGKVDWRSLYESDLADSALKYDLGPVSQAGRTVRVVICWDTNPAGDYSTDPLEQDLDLHLLFDGVVVSSSVSYSNAFEIVEATTTAPVTNVRARISKFRWDTGTSTYLGIAWGKY